jgi:tetratricopeptide (TPR) repeat protein
MVRQDDLNANPEELILDSRSIAPPQIKAWLTRANDLHLQGQWDQAEALYRQVLSSQPGHPDALHLLGLLMHQRGNHKAAIDLIGRAIAINDRSPSYFVNRGVALLAAGMADAAIEHFQAALRLRPDLAQAYLNLGNALRSQKRFPEAADSYRQAIEFSPSLAEAYFNLGIVLQEQGDFDGAANNFRETARMQPRRCDAYFHLSKCMNMTGTGGQVAREIHGLLEMNGIDDAGAAYCHFALGKIYDDLGEYANAFRHYALANELEHKYASFDRAQHSRLVDWTISTFTAEFFAARRDYGSASRRPILIVGMPRSGTTLMEQIVSSHSGVHGGGELDFWLEQGSKFIPPGHEEMTLQQVRAVGAGYLANLERLSGSAEFVTDKMPHNFLRLGLIHLAFPQAKIIHCMRNPADICLSIFFNKFTRMHGYATSMDDLAFYYREYLRLMQHWRSVLPAATLLEVRYEKLVTDQENESRRLIESLGLAWEDQCLDFYRNRRVINTPSKWQARQPIYKHSLARWKNYLPYIPALVPLAEEYERAAAREAAVKC